MARTNQIAHHRVTGMYRTGRGSPMSIDQDPNLENRVPPYVPQTDCRLYPTT